MATFHRMPDEAGRDVVRCFVKGAPDQLLARASTHLDPALETAPADEAFKARYLDENERLAAKGLRVMATARKDFDAAGFDPGADLLALMEDLTLLALVGIVDPPRAAGQGGDRHGARRRHPGAHDHRRPRRHRRGDRARARHRGPRHHGRAVRRAERRRRPTSRSTRSA